MTDNLTPARPYTWNPNDGWEHNIKALDGVWERANMDVNALRGTKNQPIVDELAVLLPSREMAMEFIDEAVQFGWCFFNRASDMVRVDPFGTVYSVEYYFLRHPERPWRFELMRKVGNGSSPLHDSLAPRGSVIEGFPVVHASFKPASGESERNYAAEKFELDRAGHWLAQECRSTYGQFGYWRKPDSNRAFYLKPRINTRDGGAL